MVERRSPRIPLVSLILCLCLGSLVVLQITNVVSTAVLEVSEVDLDQAEFDEEFFIIIILGALIANQIFSKFGSMNLDFQSASLSPVPPPPISHNLIAAPFWQ